MILPRDALVLPVHGQKPVGHGRGHALRRKQKLAFESRRVAVEQIAVRGIHHDRPLPAAEHDGEPGKKRRERGVDAYHVVLLLAYQAAQLHNCREIARRKHAFFERNRNIPRNARAARPVFRLPPRERSRPAPPATTGTACEKMPDGRRSRPHTAPFCCFSSVISPPSIKKRRQIYLQTKIRRACFSRHARHFRVLPCYPKNFTPRPIPCQGYDGNFVHFVIE